MSALPRHKSYGTPIDQWVAQVPDELAEDAVGLWQIFKGLREGFEVDGPEMESYLRRCLSLLLEKGALPVEGNATKDGWQVRTDLVATDDSTLELLIAYWRNLNRDPDLGDIWFLVP